MVMVSNGDVLINEDKLMTKIIDKVHANNSDFQKSVSSALAKRNVNDALKPTKSMDFGAHFELNKEYQDQDKENQENQKPLEFETKNKKQKKEGKSNKSAKNVKQLRIK